MAEGITPTSGYEEGTHKKKEWRSEHHWQPHREKVLISFTSIDSPVLICSSFVSFFVCGIPACSCSFVNRLCNWNNSNSNVKIGSESTSPLALGASSEEFTLDASDDRDNGG